MATKAVNQLGMDETLIENAELEAVLEERLRLQTIAGETRKRFEEQNEIARGEIEKLELGEGLVVRIGRFRITRSSVQGRSVAFETEPTTRVNIKVIGEEE